MFTPAELADRISSTAAAAGISIRSILVQAGLGKNTMSNLRNGSALQYDSLAKIAQILNCSMDYLAGMSDALNIGITEQLDERERNLVVHFRALDLDGKARVESAAANEHDRVRLEGDSTKTAL